MSMTELTVEDCLKELREMFPDTAFISVKNHAIYQGSINHQPQADIQIEDRGFRCTTLSEAMAHVRAWKESQKDVTK